MSCQPRAMRKLPAWIALALWAGPALAQDGQRTVVERLIAEANPCRDLRAEQFGVPIALDVLDEVSLDAADLSLRGDGLSASLSGRLACRSADDSLLSGDAAASIRAVAEMSLADCSIGQIDVILSEFGGDFGTLLESLAPLIETGLEEGARGPLVQACEDFRGLPDSP